MSRGFCGQCGEPYDDQFGPHSCKGVEAMRNLDFLLEDTGEPLAAFPETLEDSIRDAVAFSVDLRGIHPVQAHMEEALETFQAVTGETSARVGFDYVSPMVQSYIESLF